MLPSVDFFEKLPVIIKWNDCIKSQVLIAMKKSQEMGRGSVCVHVVYVCCTLVYFSCFEKHTQSVSPELFFSSLLKNV